MWQVEKETTLQESPWMRGPEGQPTKREPSPEGLGINPEDDTSAVGAALNPGPPRSCVIRRSREPALSEVERGSAVLFLCHNRHVYHSPLLSGLRAK